MINEKIGEQEEIEKNKKMNKSINKNLYNSKNEQRKKIDKEIKIK